MSTLEQMCHSLTLVFITLTIKVTRPTFCDFDTVYRERPENQFDVILDSSSESQWDVGIKINSNLSGKENVPL